MFFIYLYLPTGERTFSFIYDKFVSKYPKRYLLSGQIYYTSLNYYFCKIFIWDIHEAFSLFFFPTSFSWKSKKNKKIKHNDN